jgi:hypothetical protein
MMRPGDFCLRRKAPKSVVAWSDMGSRADRTPGAGVLPYRDAKEKGGEAGSGRTAMRNTKEDNNLTKTDRLATIQGEM